MILIKCLLVIIKFEIFRKLARWRAKDAQIKHLYEHYSYIFHRVLTI